MLPLLLALIMTSFVPSLVTTAATIPASKPAGVQVVGSRLLDGLGRPVRLIGVNRSGTEYACVQGWGFFDGPSDLASIQAIASWRANAVRVPLNESCWLGINGVSPTYSGANYQTAIRNYVDLLTQHGFTAILELHWSAAGSAPATGQQPMPNRDHTPAFWSQVATAYRNNRSVIFDLFNEPYPDNNQDTAEAWRCWRDGGTCRGVPFQAAGMQELVNVVRATGARNVIMLGGVQYANALTGWLANKPTDPTDNLVAAWHVYNFNMCNNTTCYDQQIAPVAQRVPLVAGEIGEDTCGHTFIDALMGWLDAHGSNYLAWTWDTWGGCGPVLITDYNGTPTAYGAGFKNHLATIIPAPSSGPPGLAGELPVISRSVPAYASGGYPAAYSNDDDYATVWRSVTAPSPSSPQWLAYDLSAVPAARRSHVVLAWYNDATSPYWQGPGGTFYAQPRDYSIEVSSGPSGTPPVSGWTTVVRVTGNTFSGRAHTLDLGGANWVRLRMTASNGGPGNDDVAIQLDIHDVSTQADSWLFLGDSITQEGTRHANINGAGWRGGNLAQLVGAATEQTRFPAIVDGGVGGMTMAWAAQNVDALLEPFQGRYVAISYGTNDANTNGPLQPAQVDGYYRNLLRVVDAVQARGLVAVVPSTPWGCASNGWLGTNAQTLNNYVAAHLWTDRPEVVRGPDLWTFYRQNPGLLRDCIHPTYAAEAGQLNGYEQFQRQWVAVIAGTTAPVRYSTPMSSPSPTVTAIPTQQPSPSPMLTVSPVPTAPAGDTMVLYDNGLKNGFTDGSFGYSARNPQDPASFVSAPYGYTLAFTAWGGLNFLAGPKGFDTSRYDTLQWAMKTNGQPITGFSVLFTDNTGARSVIKEVVLSPGDLSAALPGGWVRVAVPVARLNPGNLWISSVQIKNATGGPLAPVTIDEVRLTARQAR